MKNLVIAAMLAASFAANADTLYTGSLTYHLDRSKDYNELNTTIIYKHDSGWAAGYFVNSYYNDTFFVGKQFEYAITKDYTIGITPMVLQGYSQNEVIGLCVEKTCVTAVPTITYTKFKVQPSLMVGGTVFSLLVGYKF